MNHRSDITAVLQSAGRGEGKATEELFPLAYEELRRMAGEAAGQTLQPTALVHEAWLELAGDGGRRWENRRHFFGAAAEAMRRILILHARRKATLKLGGGRSRVPIEDLEISAATPDVNLVVNHVCLSLLKMKSILPILLIGAAVACAECGRAQILTDPLPETAVPAVIVNTKTEPVTPGKFQPAWDSLRRYQCPDWFRNAKFGIWACFGPQNQPEDGDWYARNMYVEGSRQNKYHVAHYGPPSQFGFKDVIHVWKAENFDAEKLVALYKRVGAHYFFAMANHHDNFDLYDSKYQPWNSVRVGPHQDIIGDFAKAAHEQGLPFGVSVHAAHAWSFYEIGRALRWQIDEGRRPGQMVGRTRSAGSLCAKPHAQLEF
jgi:RNA polymerase sigma factor (TIGR02999 family)